MHRSVPGPPDVLSFNPLPASGRFLSTRITPKRAALCSNLNGKVLVKAAEVSTAVNGQGRDVIRLAEV